MKYKRHDKKIVLRMDEGEEIIQTITEVCRKERIASATVQGIGFTQLARLRVYNYKEGIFVFKEITGSMEMTSLLGNVVVSGEDVFTHLHITLADESMNIRGGHLIACSISMTAEIVIEELSVKVSRPASNDNNLGFLSFE